MSRTYRRKNSHDEWWMTQDWEKQPCGQWIRVAGTTYDIAMYHSDTRRWAYHGKPTHEEKKDFARAMRCKNKAVLERSIRDRNEEPMFIPYYHPYW